MAKQKRPDRRMELTLSEEVYNHLVKHADRLGFSWAPLVRMAVVEKLHELDEQLIAQRAATAPARTIRAPEIPSVPTTGARGMEIEIKTPAATIPVGAPVTDVKTPQKLRDSFRRLCEYVEAAENHIDRSIRLQTCLDEMKERVKDPNEAHAAFVDLQKVLADRERLRNGAKVESLPQGIPVTGDVEAPEVDDTDGD